MVEFVVHDPGAETASFGLATHPAVVEHTASTGQLVTLPTGLGRGYAWHSFCKTQYAGLPKHGGPDHFLAAHTRLIQLLDHAAGLGAAVSVRDESDYWTHRDPDRLLEALEAHNRLVAAVVGPLADAASEQLPRETIHAPIHQHTDFEHSKRRVVTNFRSASHLLTTDPRPEA